VIWDESGPSLVETGHGGVEGEGPPSCESQVLAESSDTTANVVYILPHCDALLGEGDHGILVAEKSFHRVEDSLIEAAEAPPSLEMVDLEIHTTQVGLQTVSRLLHLEIEVTNRVPCVGRRYLGGIADGLLVGREGLMAPLMPH
jgi:hypothetical protein